MQNFLRRIIAVAQPPKDLPVKETEESIRKRKKFLPRYRRAGEEAPLRLQERDREILFLVYDYRFLTSHQIMRLLSSQSKNILLRLQKLYHNGYLDRLKISDNSPIVYALGNKGADELTLHTEIDRGKIDWSKKNSEAKSIHLNHTLMISNFKATLTLALHGLDIKISLWQREGEMKDKIIYYEEDNKGNEKKIHGSIFPDALFTLVDKEINGAHFFLEADRSTMTNKRFFKKMRAYFKYWKNKQCEEKQGIEIFKVLTICKTESRMKNLLSVTRSADDRQTGSGMFLFTSEERFNIEKPKTILHQIWHTSKDNSLHSLL